MTELSGFELYLISLAERVDRSRALEGSRELRSIPVEALRSPVGIGVDADVVVLGEKSVAEKLRNNWPHIVRSEIYRAAVDMSDLIYGEIIKHVPIETGVLLSQIFVEARAPIREEVMIAYGVGDLAKGYWQPVEKGSGIYGPYHRPYIVRKRFTAARLAAGPLLRPGAREGQQTKLRSLFYEHPGMRPRPYFGPGIRDASPLVRARAKEVTPRIVARIKAGGV